MKVPNPIASVEEGMHLVDAFGGRPEDFQLVVPAALLDPIGINMAKITDRVLARGWEPDGFVQQAESRVFRYKVLGS